MYTLVECPMQSYAKLEGRKCWPYTADCQAEFTVFIYIYIHTYTQSHTHTLSLTESTVQNITCLLFCSWYLWWSGACERKSLSSFFPPVKMETRQEEERVVGHSSFHHLSTTHAWLKGLCKLGGLHHLYQTASKIKRQAAAIVNIDKALSQKKKN